MYLYDYFLCLLLSVIKLCFLSSSFHTQKILQGRRGSNISRTTHSFFGVLILAFERTRFTTVTTSKTASSVLYLQFKNMNENFSCANIVSNSWSWNKEAKIHAPWPLAEMDLTRITLFVVEIFMCAQSSMVSELKRNSFLNLPEFPCVFTWMN